MYIYYQPGDFKKLETYTALKAQCEKDEGIVLRFQAKQPGPKVRLKQVDMRFKYRESFSGPFPDAYETLLWDIM
jgi:glucose-6-phosphate 1-dehydrogenase